MQTQNEAPTMEMYMKDIAKTVPISRDEERVLVSLAKNGNQMARHRILTANMRFVLGVALKFKSSPLELGDLVNEGMMGMSRAIDKFDPSTGMKFISYAVWWVRSYITKAINEYGYNSIRLPANKYRKLFASINTGNFSNLNKQEMEMIQMLTATMNIDAPVDSDSDTSLAEFIGDPNSTDILDRIETEERAELIQALLEVMPEQSRKTLKQHFFGNCTVDELQADLKVSRERIRQIKNSTLDKLRNAQRTNGCTGELLKVLG